MMQKFERLLLLFILFIVTTTTTIVHGFSLLRKTTTTITTTTSRQQRLREDNDLKVVINGATTTKTTTTTRRKQSLSSSRLYSSKYSLNESKNDNNDKNNNHLSRRQFYELSFATFGLGFSFFGTREIKPIDYGLWGILPVGTYKQKKTIMETIIPNEIWTFDQKFGILNVQVPLRMTILKLSSNDDGGLLVYNPIAATKELLGMVHKLVKEYGPIKHIILGSVALEHKVYAGVFAQKFKDAQIWIQPGQYSVPLNLPESFLGFPLGRTHFMPKTIDDAPDDWKQDIDFAILGPFISRDGSFGETVVYHKSTQTMLVTDTVVEVTDDVPLIYNTDPKPLLYHARDTITDIVEDTPEVRKKGWRRLVLFGLFFQPSAIQIHSVEQAINERRPDINSDFAGLYPWDWIENDDIKSFDALKGGLLVAPILQKLILNRSPIEVLDFADTVVTKWPNIKRIIPCHLKNNLKYTANDYRKAFSFLEAKGVPKGLPKPLDEDFETLANAEISLQESGAIAPCPPLPGGNISREDIIKQTIYQCRADVCAPKSKV